MVRVEESDFGEILNPFSNKLEKVRKFTLLNDNQMSVEVISLGATIRSIHVPDASGKVDDVVLGYDDAAAYLKTENPYFGTTVGRVANRIANGRFTLPGVGQVEVSRNWNNKHQLHGGFIGFNKDNWVLTARDNESITLQHRNPDGHEGYPGEVTATVCYTLTEDNCLHVRFTAETTKTTAVNLTNHSYFNLGGHSSGANGLYEHSIKIDADLITETDEDSIPTGKFIGLANNNYDLRQLGNLGSRLKNLEPALGFDDNYCVNLKNNRTTTIAKAFHPPTGRWLEVASNQPGVQFYTSNFMPDVKRGETPIKGKSGAQYTKHGAFCLETQKYPDAVNHANFPSIILNPGELYDHEVIYKFGVLKQ